VANNIVTTLSNMLTNLNLTDMEVCYKVFTREVIDNIKSGVRDSALSRKSLQK